MDEEAQLESVNNSRRVAAEAYETGLAILGTMAGQRDRLKVVVHAVAVHVKHSVDAFNNPITIDRPSRSERWMWCMGWVCLIHCCV